MEGAGSRSESASGRVGGERIRRVGKDGRRESPRGEERASPALLSYLVRYETSSVERTVARFSLCSCGPRPASRAVPAAIVSSRTPRAALLVGTRNFVTALLTAARRNFLRSSSILVVRGATWSYILYANWQRLFESFDFSETDAS